jgi:hypothetical protein
MSAGLELYMIFCHRTREKKSVIKYVIYINLPDPKSDPTDLCNYIDLCRSVQICGIDFGRLAVGLT